VAHCVIDTNASNKPRSPQKPTAKVTGCPSVSVADGSSTEAHLSRGTREVFRAMSDTATGTTHSMAQVQKVVPPGERPTALLKRLSLNPSTVSPRQHGFELRGFLDTRLRYFDLQFHNQYAVLYVLFFLQLHMFLYLCSR
jgi:hypothetical protein